MSTESQTRKFAAMGADGPQGRMGAASLEVPASHARGAARSDWPANHRWSQRVLGSLPSALPAAPRHYRPDFAWEAEGRNLVARMGNQPTRPPERRASTSFARIPWAANRHRMLYPMSSPIRRPRVATR